MVICFLSAIASSRSKRSVDTDGHANGPKFQSPSTGSENNGGSISEDLLLPLLHFGTQRVIRHSSASFLLASDDDDAIIQVIRWGDC
jgi:hypothetical protein